MLERVAGRSPGADASCSRENETDFRLGRQACRSGMPNARHSRLRSAASGGVLRKFGMNRTDADQGQILENVGVERPFPRWASSSLLPVWRPRSQTVSSEIVCRSGKRRIRPLPPWEREPEGAWNKREVEKSKKRPAGFGTRGPRERSGSESSGGDPLDNQLSGQPPYSSSSMRPAK
jgi:hypothetical protein